MRWSPYVLDNYLAPKLSELNNCKIPDVPELPNYRGSLVVNQLFGSSRYKESTKVALLNFIARLRTAISEFRAGREALIGFISSLPNHSELRKFHVALSKFESSILQTNISIACLNCLHKMISDIPPVYRTGDNSDYDRLRKLGNRIKHFDEDIVEATDADKALPLAPIWITNSGLESNSCSVSFIELAKILIVHSTDAKDFAETFFEDKKRAAKIDNK